MAVAREYTDEEKRVLYGAAMQVGLAVMTASSSGFEGTVHEFQTMLAAPRAAAAAFPNNGLIQAILSEEARSGAGESRPTSDEDDLPKNDTQIQTETVDACQAAANLVEQLATPQEADEYKRWLLRVGEMVAHAGKEGGFLGFGKHEVSRSEAEVLRMVASVLGIGG